MTNGCNKMDHTHHHVFCQTRSVCRAIFRYVEIKKLRHHRFEPITSGLQKLRSTTYAKVEEDESSQKLQIMNASIISSLTFIGT